MQALIAPEHATVFVLDGYWGFSLVNTIRGALQYDQAIPDVIVVGIGYAGLAPNAPEIAELRGHDDSPIKTDDHPQWGGAPEFLRFITDELAPYIEACRWASKPASSR